MKKILLISENSPSAFGGIERHCYNIQLLFQDDKNIQILSLSKEQIKYKKVKFINKVLFNERDLIRAIIKSECDVVHVHGFASFAVWQAIKAAIKCGRKIVYTAHFHPFDRLEHPFLGKLFYFFLLKPMLNKVHSIICINKEDYAFFSKSQRNVQMIPNWLNFEGHPIIKQNKKRTNIILFVGRNDANKSPEYLLDIPSNYSIHCVTNTSRGLNDKFVFHYKISDKQLKELYQTADMLVVPSRYEAFSYVALEALSQGTPVLMSSNVRIADYLSEEDGITIFQYGNHLDFKQKFPIAISKTVNVEKICDVFSPQRVKMALLNIYTINI